MNRVDALAAIVGHIHTTGIDYPTTGLVADRFEAGWAVHAPAAAGGSLDDLLDMPVGQAVFLIGDTGRIQQVSSATPPRIARSRFAAAEYRRTHPIRIDPAVRGITYSDADPDTIRARGLFDELFDNRAAELLEPITAELAAHCPPHWQTITATFIGTTTAITAEAHWQTATADGTLGVPDQALHLAARHRSTGAAKTTGAWWRLLIDADRHHPPRAELDYGDRPVPAHQLQPVDNYRADLAAQPRDAIPIWLAGYLAGPTFQSRPPGHPGTTGTPIPADGLPDPGTLFTRWAVLAAIAAGARSVHGPHLDGHHARYQPPTGDGATLHLLPGTRAVLSGGRWSSPLLQPYRSGTSAPDFYTGAPTGSTTPCSTTATNAANSASATGGPTGTGGAVRQIPPGNCPTLCRRSPRSRQPWPP